MAFMDLRAKSLGIPEPYRAGHDQRRGMIAVVTTQIAFLRAVNLGKRRVKMADAVAVLEGLGQEDVWSYINSGNLVFDGSGPRAALEAKIGDALEAEFGFEITTFVRTAAEVRKILAVEPFTMTDGDTYFITFLQAVPTAAAAKRLEACSNEFDTLVVDGRDVHWLMHGLSSATTVNQKKWKVVGERSTSRNTTMLHKLLAKIDDR
jgi:uncharacterized protein (DUF1697 family)